MEIWRNSSNQIEGKHVQQVIAFAGDGRLRDGSSTTLEFREFLSNIPSQLLGIYADQCLQKSFTDSGLALQDIVNQIGERLNFNVTYGRYRGTVAHVGFDGLWCLPDNHKIVVEVKTTDAYRIDLDILAGYRQSLINDKAIDEDKSSILIVVGRDDTGDLEAQIRGSRWAWDIRLISVDALIKLMFLKEGLEDPIIIKQIYSVLIPREFTKIDEIVNIVFFTTLDIKEDSKPDEENSEESSEAKSSPVAFHIACITRIDKILKTNLIRRSRALFSTADGLKALICAVSKEHERGGQIWYWFAFHPHQKEFLKDIHESYVAFGCGSEKQLLLIPFIDFERFLDDLNITERPNSFYWHVHILKEGTNYYLHRKSGQEKRSLKKYLI